MANNYVICEYERVKEYFPEFNGMMQNLEADLLSRAQRDWAPLVYGGFNPKSGQFGRTTIIPALFNDNAGTRMTTWEQTITALGHQTLLTGSAGNNAFYEDYKIGLAGFAFLDDAMRISELKMYISDKKIARMNIEEAYCYNKPAIVFEQGFTLDEETNFELFAFATSFGKTRIMPIGFQVNRVKDKLVTNPGSALT